MPTVTRSARIAAAATDIWDILARLDEYASWESGYVSSAYDSERTRGLGATRRVELKSPMGVRHAEHVITSWDPGSVIAWQASNTNFPFLAAAEQIITLRPAGSATDVENRLDYALKYGPLGSLIDALMFRRVVSGAADGFLSSLAARAAQPERAVGWGSPDWSGWS